MELPSRSLPETELKNSNSAFSFFLLFRCWPKTEWRFLWNTELAQFFWPPWLTSKAWLWELNSYWLFFREGNSVSSTCTDCSEPPVISIPRSYAIFWPLQIMWHTLTQSDTHTHTNKNLSCSPSFPQQILGFSACLICCFLSNSNKMVPEGLINK